MIVTNHGVVVGGYARGGLVDPVTLSYVHGLFETHREENITYLGPTTAEGTISYTAIDGNYVLATGASNPRPWQPGEIVDITGIVPNTVYPRQFPTTYTVTVRTNANTYTMTSEALGPVDSGTATGTGGVKQSRTSRIISAVNPGLWGGTLQQASVALLPQVGVIDGLSCIREPAFDTTFVATYGATEELRQGDTGFIVLRRTGSLASADQMSSSRTTAGDRYCAPRANNATQFHTIARCGTGSIAFSPAQTLPLDSWILVQVQMPRLSSVLTNATLRVGNSAASSSASIAAAWDTVVTSGHWSVGGTPAGANLWERNVAVAAHIRCSGDRLNDPIILDWFRNHPVYAEANGGTGLVMPAA